MVVFLLVIDVINRTMFLYIYVFAYAMTSMPYPSSPDTSYDGYGESVWY